MSHAKTLKDVRKRYDELAAAADLAGAVLKACQRADGMDWKEVRNSNPVSKAIADNPGWHPSAFSDAMNILCRQNILERLCDDRGGNCRYFLK